MANQFTKYTPQEEMSFDEIGQKLGLSGEQARRIYLRAMRKLRETLKNRPAQAEACRQLIQDDRSLVPRGANTRSLFNLYLDGGYKDFDVFIENNNE